MSDWKFKMGWEGFEVECARLTAEIDNHWNRKQEYYEMYEPERWGKLHQKVLEIDRECSAKEDYAGIIKGMGEMLSDLQAEDKRLCTSISAAMIKRVHATKTQVGLDDGTYRGILMNTAAVETSKDLNYWQAMVVLRKIHKVMGK